MPTYGRWDVAVDRGEGCYLYATDGRKFLDFTSGIAVTSLGHCHPHLIKAVTEQAQKLWHSSNLFQIPGQQRLAERLTANSFADTVFFNNSGAEAVELSIKVARKYQSETGHPERYRVIGCHGSFHGRSFATLAAAGAEAYLKGFGPVMDGLDHVAFNNLNEMRAAVTDETAAILVEPVQGEGGVLPADPAFLKGLREACDQHGALLIFDEVQTGVGRTGTFYAYMGYGVTPDILTTAKALGNGFPIGAMLTTDKIAAHFKVGVHGTTYGGNPLGAAVADKVVELISDPALLEGVQQRSAAIKAHLKRIDERFSVFKEIRGKGLLIGAELADAYKDRAKDVLNTAAKHGVIMLIAGPNVLRFAPSLIMPMADLDEGFARIEKAIAELAH